MTLQVLINSAQADVTLALSRADDREVRRAFQEVRDALGRCETPDDVRYVQGIFTDVKRDTILYGVNARMSRASIRLDLVRRRS